MHVMGQAESARYALAPSREARPLSRMARKPKTAKPSPYKVRSWRKAMGKTLEDVAGALGMSPQNLGKIERGLVDLLPDHLAPLAAHLGIAPADLLREPTDSTVASKSVAVVGFVGAGSVATLFSEGQGPFDHVEPPSNANDNTVGLRVEGGSLGPAWADAVIFYDDVRSPVTPDQHGRLCVVGLEDGRVLVKILRSAGDGTFHLFSNTLEEPMLNERVTWAARVKAAHPR